MNRDEHEKLIGQLDDAVHKDNPFTGLDAEHLRARLQEEFWKFPMKKRKQILDAILWDWLQLGSDNFWKRLQRVRIGLESPNEAIHNEADKFYATGKYTPWGAAKKAVELAKMNPGEFTGKIPTVDAINKALKKRLEEQK